MVGDLISQTLTSYILRLSFRREAVTETARAATRDRPGLVVQQHSELRQACLPDLTLADTGDKILITPDSLCRHLNLIAGLSPVDCRDRS